MPMERVEKGSDMICPRQQDRVVGDITGNGKLDILGKPWPPVEGNAVGGKMFVVFLEGI